MKISIGINGYKDFKNLEKREKFCLESLQKLVNDRVSIYNVCYTDEHVEYPGVKTLNKLTKKSNEIILKYFQHEGLVKEYNTRKNEIDNNQKVLPSVKEIFDVLAETDCDYFLFLNNDIIFSNRFFKKIKTEIDCYAISRMHIYDIDSLNDTPKLESYSVHGFDAFFIKKEVWKKIRNNFPDLILGRFYWDTFYATRFQLLCNTEFVNDLPPVCFHIEHKSKSSENTIENYYCEEVFKRDLISGPMWFNYVQNILLKRQTVNDCKWYLPFENEKEIEKRHFKQFDQTSLTIQTPEIKITSKKDCDLFIPVAPKDEKKLKFVIEYAKEYTEIKDIFICSPHTITNKIQDSCINYINDKDVLDIPDKSFIGFRPNWTYQQFLKLFFSQSNSDYYFALDADTIIVNKLNLFDSAGKPIWYYGWEQNNFPYFLFNKKFFNLDKTLQHTGIGDLGLFNRNITKAFLDTTGFKTPESLLRHIGPKTNVLFHFSEYETYANFVDTYFNKLYTFKFLNQKNLGRDLNQGQDWTVEDIKNTIQMYKENKFDTLSLHSWKI